MADEKYNGWRNVETWRVQLHLANDEQTEPAVRRAIRTFAKQDSPPFSCAEWLRAYVEARVLPEVGSVEDTWAQFSSDTLTAALERVDWHELAGYWATIDIRDAEAPA